MLVAKIGGYTVLPGSSVEFTHKPFFHFRIIKILSNGFRAKWLAGPKKDHAAYIPFSEFGELGVEVSIEIMHCEGEDDPNAAFRLHKLEEG